MTQNKNIISLKYKAILTMLAAALLASCTNLISRTPQDVIGGGIDQGDNSSRGALTVSARVSNGASRYAMPSIPELVYAALLYKDGDSPATPSSTDFVKGTKAADSYNLVFSFQKPENTSGNFTLEVFAFVKAAGEGTTTFSRGSALFSGGKDGLAIEGDEIQVNDPIALSSSKQGTVNLKITVLADCSLDIDDTAKAKFKCERESETPNTYSITASEISADAYPVTFTVKKGTEPVHIFTEYINVINGLCTDTWSGLEKGEAKDVAQSMSKTLYVRGAGGWYETSTYNASDENSGTYLSPLATIQKAIDKAIAINDGASEYTIYVDGKLMQSTPVENMASIAPDTSLNLKIESLSANMNATLDAANNGRVMSISSDRGGIPNVTLKNIHITGGNATENGGGVYVSGGTFTMVDCKITECTASNGGGIYNKGTLTVSGGTISECTATDSGGGIYNKISTSSVATTITNCIISGCKASGTSGSSGGGGIYNYSGKLEVTGVTITGGNDIEKLDAENGGGVYFYTGTFTMSGGEISGNTAKNAGGGVYFKGSSFTIKDDGKISGNKCKLGSGGGVFLNYSTFTMESGTISSNESMSGSGGGGVYVWNCTFTMNGGTISGNTAKNGNGVYVTSQGTLKMSGKAKVSEDNDVYLYKIGENFAKIAVAGALTAESPVATITPSTYAAGTPVLTKGANVTAITQDICDKFALSEDGWKIMPNDDGSAGVLVIDAIYLNSSSGNDTNSGLTASKAVQTLSKAIEKYDTYNAEKIMVCAPYTLPSGETTLLNRASKTKVTLMRYDSSSDVSYVFTGTLLTISQGTVTISNVTLDGNKENVSAKGSLLYIDGSDTIVTLGDGATVCNNNTTTQNGGGVYVNSGTFTMEGGTISGNTVKSYGGGVYVYGGMFTMEDGIISGNSSKDFGGGVLVAANGNFTMSGGTVRGNTATNRGNGAFIDSPNTVTFKMSGTARFDENNDVCLAYSSNKQFAKICVTGELTAATPVATITLYDSAYTASRKILTADDTNGTAITQSICDKFALTPDPAGTNWEIVPNDDGTAGVLEAK